MSDGPQTKSISGKIIYNIKDSINTRNRTQNYKAETIPSLFHITIHHKRKRDPNKPKESLKTSLNTQSHLEPKTQQTKCHKDGENHTKTPTDTKQPFTNATHSQLCITSILLSIGTFSKVTYSFFFFFFFSKLVAEVSYYQRTVTR